MTATHEVSSSLNVHRGARRVAKIRTREAADHKWSGSQTLGFVVLTSTGLWGVIGYGVYLLVVR